MCFSMIIPFKSHSRRILLFLLIGFFSAILIMNMDFNSLLQKASYGAAKTLGNTVFPKNQKDNTSRGVIGDFLEKKAFPPIVSPLADGFPPKAQAQELPADAPPPPFSGHNIQIPASQGTGMTKVPENIAQLLMENFDDIGEATNAARVLHHPREQTYSPAEIERYGKESWTHGENASFRTGQLDSLQANGTTDRGLMRTNSGTFDGMQANPFWNQAMEKRGITSFDDLIDTANNVEMARLILDRGNWDNENGRTKDNPDWTQWFAAPLDLRYR